MQAFQERVKNYLNLQKKAAKEVPSVDDEAEPEEIAARRKGLAEEIRLARDGAAPGDIFGTAAPLLRGIVLKEFQGYDGEQVRALIKETPPPNIALHVNRPYPDGAALATVPPSLLAQFPPLPEEVQYRFANQHLILLDIEANLIIDYLALEPVRKESSR